MIIPNCPTPSSKVCVAGSKVFSPAFCVDDNCVTKSVVTVTTVNEKCEPLTTEHFVADSSGQPTAVLYIGKITRVSCEVARVKMVDVCDAPPPALLKIEFSETKLYSAETELGLFRIREYNEGTGVWAVRYENLDGTPFTATLPTDLTAVSAQVSVTRTTALGCANNIPYLMRETARFDSETGTLESELIDWVDSAGVVIAAQPIGFTLGACPVAQPQDKELLVTAPVRVCIAGGNWLTRDRIVYDSQTAAIISIVTEYSAQGITWSAVQPSGGSFEIGECPKEKWVVEKACYGTGEGTLPPSTTDVLYEPNTGVPMNAGAGSTGAADTYIHAVFAIYQGNNVADFNADDATQPFDSSTHGGIVMTNTATAQAAVDAAVTAIEAAAGQPAGTYKATYYLTTALPQQVVLVYNSALSAEVANGTYINSYVGTSDAFASYQEKPDMNVPSSLTAADLQVGGKLPIEITKLISSSGAILQRRVWDDRTEPPTEIVGFDPKLIVDCVKECSVAQSVGLVANWG